jgi:hypothetical protein
MPDGSASDLDRGADPVVDGPVADPERLRQRAIFLRELAEARALLARATPRRTRTAQLRARLRHSTFRF